MTTNNYEKERLAIIAEELGQARISLIHLIHCVNDEEGFKELKDAFDHLHNMATAYDELIVPALR